MPQELEEVNTVNEEMLMPQDKVKLPAKPKRGGAPKHKSFRHNLRKQKKFLENLQKDFNMSSAAKSVGVCVQTIYKYMDDDENFKQLVEEARDIAVEEAEGEAYRRGVKGVEKTVWHQGQPVGVEIQHSDRLLELFLKGRRPEVYGNKQSIDIQGSMNVEVSQAKTKLLSLLGVSSLDDIEEGDVG